MLKTINYVSKFGPQRRPRSDLTWPLSGARIFFKVRVTTLGDLWSKVVAQQNHTILIVFKYLPILFSALL